MKSSKAVKSIRMQLFKDRKQFAEMVGISQQSIIHYENSLRRPKLSIIKKMIDIAKENNIEISPSDFFD